MFTLQVGFISPSFVGIVPSIEMVIAAAVGGRQSLFGAVYGTLLVNFGKTYFSESFPELWLFLLGALFIAVVMIFPNGLSGLRAQRALPLLQQLSARLRRSTGVAGLAVPNLSPPHPAPSRPGGGDGPPLKASETIIRDSGCRSGARRVNRAVRTRAATFGMCKPVFAIVDRAGRATRSASSTRTRDTRER